MKHRLLFLYLIHVLNEITGGRISIFLHGLVLAIPHDWRLELFHSPLCGGGGGGHFTTATNIPRYPLSPLYIPVILVCTVPSSCYPAPAAGRFGARESYYRLCVASTTSAAMRRAIETPRDTGQWGHRTHGWGAERAFAPGANPTLASVLGRPRRSGPHWAAGDGSGTAG